MAAIISTEEALKIISEIDFSAKTEQINFQGSLKRVLAEEIFADSDFPPFNRSAMDGYACRREDFKEPLSVIEEIPAGKSPTKVIAPGQCSKIMTGAEVPQGADTVIIKEEITMLEGGRILFTGEKTSSNISFKGEDIQRGEKILDRGIILQPEHLAVLAGVGKTDVKVYKNPSVAILVTGAEVISPEFSPGKGQIRNSNGPQLQAQLEELGITANNMGIVTDEKIQIENKLLAAMDAHDLTIVSGGISVGDYDFVPAILKEFGCEILFSQLSSKPGKHTILGRKGNKFILGLPGNPVSSFVQFEILGKTLIYKLAGTDWKPMKLAVSLSDSFGRKNTDRSEIIPVKINKHGEAEFLSYHGSAHIHALCYANALMEIPLGVKEIKKGEAVYVRPL
jgi:molybdopterin molybdotransferase